MKNTTLILTLAIASLLSWGGISMASRPVGQKKVAKATPQKITVMYGDVPVSLAVDTFQMPFDPAVLAH
jgi:hypothetical protein